MVSRAVSWICRLIFYFFIFLFTFFFYFLLIFFFFFVLRRKKIFRRRKKTYPGGDSLAAGVIEKFKLLACLGGFQAQGISLRAQEPRLLLCEHLDPVLLQEDIGVGADPINPSSVSGRDLVHGGWPGYILHVLVVLAVMVREGLGRCGLTGGSHDFQ